MNNLGIPILTNIMIVMVVTKIVCLFRCMSITPCFTAIFCKGVGVGVGRQPLVSCLLSWILENFVFWEKILAFKRRS